MVLQGPCLKSLTEVQSAITVSIIFPWTQFKATAQEQAQQII